MITRGEFAIRLLNEMDWPTTWRNQWALLSWMQAEGNAGKFNPLNSTQKMPGSTDFNSVPVQNYVDLDQGVAATAKTLRQNQVGYPKIRWCFSHNAWASKTLKAVEASVWGTGGLALQCLPWVKKYTANYSNKTIAQ